MKIILITEKQFPPVNRANLRMYRLAKILVKKGYSIYFVSPSHLPWARKKGCHEGINIRQFRGFDKFLYSKLRLLVRLYHLIACIGLIKKINREYELDFIHAWNPLASLAGIFAGKMVKKPVFIDFTDFYSDIAKTDSNALTVWFFRKIEGFVLKNAKGIFVVSEIMKQRLQLLGINEDKIEIVEDGVDKNMFKSDIDKKMARNKLKLSEDDPMVIYHGDIKQPDGVDILYKAFQKVLEKIPKTKLLILGGGGDYFNNVIKKLGKELEINNSIIYAGWVDHSKVPLYLAASDIGAMPMRATLNHECYLSFKLFEYWASGKPVVTTRLKAISQIVKDGQNGIITEPENINELAQNLIYLIKNPKEAERMGKSGRKLVEEKFDWDRLMEKEAKAYLSYSSY